MCGPLFGIPLLQGKLFIHLVHSYRIAFSSDRITIMNGKAAKNHWIRSFTALFLCSISGMCSFSVVLFRIIYSFNGLFSNSEILDLRRSCMLNLMRWYLSCTCRIQERIYLTFFQILMHWFVVNNILQDNVVNTISVPTNKNLAQKVTWWYVSIIAWGACIIISVLTCSGIVLVSLLIRALTLGLYIFVLL